MTFSIRVISDPTEFLRNENVWNNFIAAHSQSPFLLGGFIAEFMSQNFANGWNPLVLVISSDEGIIGVAPLMIKTNFGVRFAKFLLKSSFSPDLVVDNKRAKECIALIIDYLFNTVKCRFVDLTLEANPRTLRILKQESKTHKIHFYEIPINGHRILPTSCTWDQFEALRGGNYRRKIKKMKQHLNQLGSFRVISMKSGDGESDGMARIVEVERRSWKEEWRAKRGQEIDEDLLGSWKASQHVAMTTGCKWRLWLLELNNQTLAYALILEHKQGAFIVKTSYDARYRRFYPGILVINEAIHEMLNEGQIKTVDFLTDLPFMETWTQTVMPRVRTAMRKGALPITIDHLRHSLLAHAEAHAKRILESVLGLLMKSMPSLADLIVS